MKRKTFYVLLIALALSLLTAGFGIMPKKFEDWLIAASVCFVFWLAMLAPAFNDEN